MKKLFHFIYALDNSSFSDVKSDNYNIIGFCYYNMGNNYETAKCYFQSELEYSSSNEQKGINNRSLGLCYFFTGEYYSDNVCI